MAFLGGGGGGKSNLWCNFKLNSFSISFASLLMQLWKLIGDMFWRIGKSVFEHSLYSYIKSKSFSYLKHLPLYMSWPPLNHNGPFWKLHPKEFWASFFLGENTINLLFSWSDMYTHNFNTFYNLQYF